MGVMAVNDTKKRIRILKPQEGPQEMFLSSDADIVIYGGAAGGGKTYGLLLSALRYKNVKGFGCTIFRHNHNQIFSQGGLWDEAMDMYSGIRGAEPKVSKSSWEFSNSDGMQTARVTFAHIEDDRDLPSWQGSQICEIGFDELTHFSEKTFFFMLSRNRSTCGVKPFVRATCNPDPDSWVAKFISWWIDQETGYPIKDRSGVVRWMLRRDNLVYWANSKEELTERFKLRTRDELAEPKSVTFIMSRVEDNQELLKVNPGYLANLKAMPEVERERLLEGNWKIRPAAGLFFKRIQAHVIPVIPANVKRWVRGWDLAATTEDESGEAAFTASVLMGKTDEGRYIIADVTNARESASDVRKSVRFNSTQDRLKYRHVKVRLPQDPGQAGKDQAQSFIKFLSGFDVTAVPESGDKATRAAPFAAQWQGGNVDVVYGPWNDMYFDQLENFPSGKFKDMVDASSSAFSQLELDESLDISALIS